MQTLTIGLVQMRCEKGAIHDNLASIRASLQVGMSKGIDIMCFSEMSITGYTNPLRCPEAILQLDGPEVTRFVGMTEDIPVMAIAGLIEANPQGKPFIKIGLGSPVSSERGGIARRSGTNILTIFVKRALLNA